MLKSLERGNLKVQVLETGCWTPWCPCETNKLDCGLKQWPNLLILFDLILNSISTYAQKIDLQTCKNYLHKELLKLDFNLGPRQTPLYLSLRRKETSFQNLDFKEIIFIEFGDVRENYIWLRVNRIKRKPLSLKTFASYSIVKNLNCFYLNQDIIDSLNLPSNLHIKLKETYSLWRYDALTLYSVNYNDAVLSRI